MTRALGRDSRLAQREELLERVRAGDLAPDEADEKADELRLERLSRRFPTDEFHPNGLSRWTLPMVLAWITWRTYAEVREWDFNYVARCRELAPLSNRHPNSEDVRGHDLCRRRVPNASMFERHGDRRFGDWIANKKGEPVVLSEMRAKHAKAELWRALEEGEIVAEGLQLSGGPRIEIPAREWVDLRVAVGVDGQDTFHFEHEKQRPAYKDIRWPRAQVLERWPPHQRSDIDERGDIRLNPVVANAGVFDELYIWLEADSLTVSSDDVCDGPRRQVTKKDHEDFAAAMRRRLADEQEVFDDKETQVWAAARNIGRDESRKLLQELDADLKRKRGQHRRKRK